MGMKRGRVIERDGTFTSRICLYHGIDLDGFCSGAIYAKAMERVEHRLVPANYGWSLPWDDFVDADVTMIDFTLGAADMEALLDVANTVTVIDHHKTAIEELGRFEGQPDVELVMDPSKAGCELAWGHFFPNNKMPLAVHLLGRYDVWDHEDIRTLPFQYGCRNEDLRPDVGQEKWMWRELLGAPDNQRLINGIIRDGKAVLRYQRKEDEIAAKALTQSEFLSGMLALQEQVEDMELDGMDLQAAADELRSAADEVRELGADQESKVDSMPEGLQQGEVAEMMRARAEQAEELAQELEAAADDVEGLAEAEGDPDEPGQDVVAARAEAARDVISGIGWNFE